MKTDFLRRQEKMKNENFVGVNNIQGPVSRSDRPSMAIVTPSL